MRADSNVPQAASLLASDGAGVAPCGHADITQSSNLIISCGMY